MVCQSKVSEKSKGFISNILSDGLDEDDKSAILDNAVEHFYTAVVTFGDTLDQRLYL